MRAKGEMGRRSRDENNGGRGVRRAEKERAAWEGGKMPPRRPCPNGGDPGTKPSAEKWNGI